MREILIKGIEMPKDMSNPLHISIFSNVSVWITHEGKTEATAIEVPTHGRLIDADALKETLMKSAYPEQREWYFAEACQFIDEAPTIIEASKE